MPELDLHASAREVADLLNCNRTADALERLDALRQNQSLVVREALDRLIAVEAGEQLATLARPGSAAAHDAGNAGPVFERLRTSTGAPRFPSEEETRHLSQAQLHDVYASIVASRGDQAARQSLGTNNQRVILGLRDETRTTVNDGTGQYDDRVVVVWKDNQGNRHAREFNDANTEPSAQYDHHAGSDGTRRYADGGNAPRQGRSPGYESVVRRKIEGDDVNGDGIRDLGRLGEGTTEMLATTHPTYAGGRPNGNEFALRPTAQAVAAGAGRVQRDSNADGWFTDADANGIQGLNITFKIHRGSGGGNTDSAGCQTISGAQYDEFVSEVRGNPQQNRWQYVLTSTVPAPQPQQAYMAPSAGQTALAGAPVVDSALPLRHPSSPAHPDHGLHRQILDGLEALCPSFHERTEELAMSMLAAAKAHGLSRVDHVFASHATESLKQGEHLFLVQGKPDDPASARARVNTAVAASTSLEESLSRIDCLNLPAANAPAIAELQRPIPPHATGVRVG